MNRYASRKFIVTLLSCLATTVLCWFGKINPGEYATVTIAVVSAYMAGNVWKKKVGAE